MLVREGEDYSIHLISKGELTLSLWNPLCSKPGLSVPLGGARGAEPRLVEGLQGDPSPCGGIQRGREAPL